MAADLVDTLAGSGGVDLVDFDRQRFVGGLIRALRPGLQRQLARGGGGRTKMTAGTAMAALRRQTLQLCQEVHASQAGQASAEREFQEALAQQREDAARREAAAAAAKQELVVAVAACATQEQLALDRQEALAAAQGELQEQAAAHESSQQQLEALGAQEQSQKAELTRALCQLTAAQGASREQIERLSSTEAALAEIHKAHQSTVQRAAECEAELREAVSARDGLELLVEQMQGANDELMAAEAVSAAVRHKHSLLQTSLREVTSQKVMALAHAAEADREVQALRGHASQLEAQLIEMSHAAASASYVPADSRIDERQRMEQLSLAQAERREHFGTATGAGRYNVLEAAQYSESWLE
eukprot:SAG22_NODE_4557_length_1235_cov_0.889085_1_plen_357_part_01